MQKDAYDVEINTTEQLHPPLLMVQNMKKDLHYLYAFREQKLSRNYKM